ncbi:MAG TPA: beta-propeller fold lactonase family protein [Candidatus Sulfotelmatobacter sp.]|nr:beta-propeller fold lactonase family protein [Candidatus Sulfotelmatobacter sp.]
MLKSRPLSASLFVSLLFVLAFTLACSSGKANFNSPTCSSCQFVYATTNSAQILTFQIASDGSLGAPQSTAGPANATGISTIGDGWTASFLYVSDPGNNAIRVYNISSMDGSLSPSSLGPYPVSNTPGALAVVGTILYVASSSGNIFAFTINQDGSLTGVVGSPFQAGAGLSHLAVASAGTATLLYGANTDDANGSISAFSIATNGVLTAVAGSPFPTVSGGGPEGFYVSGKVLYVALKNSNAVAALAIASDGSLGLIAPFPAGKGTTSLGGADGFLFAANNSDGTISSYSINATSGMLTQVPGSPFPAATPSGDVLYDNGKLFMPNASGNSINGFSPDLSSGAINLLTGSPYGAGTGPLQLTAFAFPVMDPP